MSILSHRNIFLIASGVLLLSIIGLLGIAGIPLGIEFTGGSILEVSYEQQRPTTQEVRQLLSDLDTKELIVQPVGDRGMILRMGEISPETHEQILERLGEGVEEQSFESIGPVIGRELRDSTFLIVGLSIGAILGYIMIAFRHVIRPLHSWQYSVASILALIHDLIVPLGVLVVVGIFYPLYISIPIVVALLTVLGYSINNTVVVFDRIRENLFRDEQSDFQITVEASIRQTISRNLSTSFTTLLVLGAIFFFGGETLRPFALTLIVGIIAGTYSSIVLAPSFLLMLASRRG